MYSGVSGGCLQWLTLSVRYNMHVLLTSSTVCFDGQPVGRSLDTAGMERWAGVALRSRDIPLHPSGVRAAHVSAKGIVWYVDQPENRVSHLFFALSPDDTPERPVAAFQGSIYLDIIPLSSETSEAHILCCREVQARGAHHTLFYDTLDHHVAFGFMRRRNRLGKRSGAHRLAFLEIGFGHVSEPAGAARGSQPIRSETNRTSSAAGSRRRPVRWPKL